MTQYGHISILGHIVYVFYSGLDVSGNAGGIDLILKLNILPNKIKINTKEMLLENMYKYVKNDLKFLI